MREILSGALLIILLFHPLSMMKIWGEETQEETLTPGKQRER